MSTFTFTTDSTNIHSGLRLLFAGTPEFAAIHLQALLDSQHTVLAVYTQPDRPAGRGRQLKASPVKQLAQQHQLPVAQPVSLKSKSQQQVLADVGADLMVVVAYGLLLPRSVLDIPPWGCINVHPSNLPRWRGPAPIQRAILAGDNNTGVCIMQMDAGLDTGPILLHRQLAISNTDTSGSLHNKLAQLGATMLVDSLDQLQAGHLHSTPQSQHGVCYAKKLIKTEAAIDWCQDAVQIGRQVRGLNPWPVCYSDLQGLRLRVWSARPVLGSSLQPPGTLLQLNDQGLLVACGQDCLMIDQLQWPGKKAVLANQLASLQQRLPLGVCFYPTQRALQLSGSKSRWLAAQALVPILQGKASLATSLPPLLKQADAGDTGLIQEMVYGCVRYHLQLHLLSQTLLRKTLAKRDLDIEALLLLGIYQLRHMRIPDYAAVTETVNASCASGKIWAKGLLNGVLRQYQRDQQKLVEQLCKRPDFMANHPHWLVAKLQHHWPQHWQDILVANDQRAPMTLRVNQRHMTVVEYLQILRQQQIIATPCNHSTHGLTLAQTCAVSKLPGFVQGWVSVQDEAPQLAGHLLKLQDGQKVLDACAAPGGKTCQLLEMAQLELTAIDSKANRLQLVQQNLSRLGLQAQLVCGDATQPNGWWDGQLFDRILLDVPCSGTGVIRRNPDIKLLRTNDDILTLSNLQFALLQNLWPLLAPDGILLYATCSVLRQENDRVVQRFLQQEKQALETPIEAEWGIALPVGRQLLPQQDGHDGFYYARLKKRLLSN